MSSVQTIPISYVVELDHENNVLMNVKIRHADAADLRWGVYWAGLHPLYEYLDYLLTDSTNREIDVELSSLSEFEQDAVRRFIAYLRYHQ